MLKKILLFVIVLFFPTLVCALEYPKLNSKSIYVYDLTDEKVLYEVNQNKQTSVASLTKIATIITAIESIDNLDQKVIITNNILKTVSLEASKAGLKEGDEVTYRDLLYASMLPSGADATNALAILSSGSIKNFVIKMNDLKTKIGLTNTNFVNVSGLDEKDHYSTSSDITKILIYSLKNSDFKKIYTTKKYTLSNGLVVESTITSNYYNSKYDTSKIIGSKTGYTLNAGYCLSSLSNINNHEILITLLNAQKLGDKFYNVIDTVDLMNFIEANYDERILKKKNSHIKSIPVNLSNIDKYEIVATSDVKKYLPKDYNKDNFKAKYVGLDHLNFMDRKGKEIGDIHYYYEDKEFYREKVILNKDINISVIKIVKKFWYIIIFTTMIFWYFNRRIKNNKYNT